jgi:hypothetical protein
VPRTPHELALERKYKRVSMLRVWVPPPLRRDIVRIAKFEGDKPLSRMCAGLLRLGIERYFEMGDSAKVAPLRALMQDLFAPEQWIPPVQVASEATKAVYAAQDRRRKNNDEFDAAIEEGQRNFEAARC